MLERGEAKWGARGRGGLTLFGTDGRRQNQNLRRSQYSSKQRDSEEGKRVRVKNLRESNEETEKNLKKKNPIRTCDGTRRPLEFISAVEPALKGKEGGGNKGSSLKE